MKITAMKEQSGNEIRKISTSSIGEVEISTSPTGEVEISTSQIEEVEINEIVSNIGRLKRKKRT